MKLFNALKEVFISSLPLVAVVIVVCVFIAPMPAASDYVKLTIGYVSVVLGQAIFLEGLNISILPVGKLVGNSLVRLKKPTFIIFFGVVFGLLATVAEPALVVLARQTNMIMPVISEPVFVWIMGAGIGVMVGFALYRIMKNLNIKLVFALLYGLVFLAVFFVPEQFVALAFDGSGATTGDISVPFILALGIGVAGSLMKKKSSDDTFGIIGLASVGPILALFIYGIMLKARLGGVFPPANVYDPGAAESLGEIFGGNLLGVALALVPVIAVFVPFQIFLIKLPKRDFIRILLGSVSVYIGLLIFLSGIDYGFAFAGKYIGEVFLNPDRPVWFKWILPVVGFVLGGAITLSEPAVTVLGEQLEEITNGHITKGAIRATLAIGIAFASLIAMVKILTEINILWFLVPLYAIAVGMMKFTSPLFVALAFDSGGVTGGALTSAFLTPLTLGAAQAVAAQAGPAAQSVLTNGFGIVAFISVTPLIAVQALGIIYDARLAKAKAALAREEQLEIEELEALMQNSEEPQTQAQNGEEPEVQAQNGEEPETQTQNGEESETQTQNGEESEVQMQNSEQPEAQTQEQDVQAEGASSAQ